MIILFCSYDWKEIYFAILMNEFLFCSCNKLRKRKRKAYQSQLYLCKVFIVSFRVQY